MQNGINAIASVLGFVALAALGIEAAAGSATAAEEGEAEAVAVSAETMEEGQALYMKHCRFCHGSKGTAGTALKGNERVADASYVVHVILEGPGYMTPFKDHLADEEIALITTFVRNAWGHDYGPMLAEEVAPLR